ncbi:hypothetical protein ES677_10075 [Bizionia gelidisalsuginis]|uniref:DoxX family membrane protein n=2 Tax=Bizionia TaxID=283785 RepID=A0A8H2LHJ5_9FLAO|nr:MULTISPECIES: hypothetical protein [Bizionia]TYB76117.1 hypothetical protein ES676_06600 [Bizionia saleffrena]TYC11409.1 hypothetical protein ES677_10075 [Bizionia gelidisalsuginis]
MIVNTSKTQNTFRILMGLAMLFAGIAHLTFKRIEFQAQVPTWLSTEEGFVDFIVLASGVVEIIFGALMVWGGKIKVFTGIALALFYVLVFPGNISQYTNGFDSFGLNTDAKRLTRLFFQPVLILWSLWASGGLKYIMSRRSNH